MAKKKETLNWQKYIAELVGTFALTLAISASIVSNMPVATAVVAGLTLGLVVYTIGGISGAHVNPAVTISLASIKKITTQDAAMYIVAQVLGAFMAMNVINILTGGKVMLDVANTSAVGFAELLGTFFLLWGISSVVYGKVSDAASGLTIGGSLTLGIIASAGVSNGILNPAVAIGMGSASAMYLLAPIAGGLLSVWLYRYIVK